MSFRQRRDLLHTHFPPVIPDNAAIARLEHVESCDSDEGRDAMEEFWQKAVAGRSEGLMIKVGYNSYHLKSIDPVPVASRSRRGEWW